jgi:phosphoserine phosphatase RsbU/P
VARPTPDYLQLYHDSAPELLQPAIEDIASLPTLLDAFARATGWSLRYVPQPLGDRAVEPASSRPCIPAAGLATGHLKLEAGRFESAGAAPCVDRDSARCLADAVGDVLGEMLTTRHALWQREAELAAGVPLVPAADDHQHLAARLEAVLKGGTEAVECQAAALYLLDEATSQLKLRSCWGLPRSRLTAPARPLRGSVADLEALLGSAVVLDDDALMQRWKVPEDCASAVCVPVASPSTILGTLWIFCTTKREFSPAQTNLLEIVAGRLAAELEREMLLREGIDGARLKRQMAAAERWQQDQFPSIAPQVDGWALAGWTAAKQALGGAIFDWFCLPDGRVATVAGVSAGRGIEAALAAASTRAALRAHAQYPHPVHEVVQELNRTLWTSSAGGQQAALCYGVCDPLHGRLHYASAGQVEMVLIRSDGWQSLSRTSPHVGEHPDVLVSACQLDLQPREALIVLVSGASGDTTPAQPPLGGADIAAALAGQLHRPAGELILLVRQKLEGRDRPAISGDCALLAVQRTGS